MEELVVVRKVGGSLVATIPKELVKELGIKENDKVRLEIKKPLIDAFGIYKGTKLTPFTREDREEMWPER